MTKQEYINIVLEKLKSDPVQACVEWPFLKYNWGYGQLSYDGELVLVHRLAYRLYYGKTPAQWVLHKCDNPFCFNPLHLYEGDVQQNAIDMIRNNWMCGQRKLTARDVKKIIQLLTEGNLDHEQIAQQFDVTAAAVSAINTGRTWMHIPRDGKPPAKQYRRSWRAITFDPAEIEREISGNRNCKTRRDPASLSPKEIETIKGLRERGFSNREIGPWFNLRPKDIREVLK